MSTPTENPPSALSLADAGLGDTITLAFADEAQECRGLARVQLDVKQETAHALVATFVGDRCVSISAQEAPLHRQPSAGLTVGDLAVHDRDGGWEVQFAGDAHGQGAFALSCAVVDEATDPDDVRRIRRVHVTGELHDGAQRLELAAAGQVTLWRDAKASTAALTRELSVWVQDGYTIDLCAVRERRRDDPERERVRAVVVEQDPSCVTSIEDPRLSATYDAEGRPLRAGLELWASEESTYPRRSAGAAVCVASVTAPAGQWDCAFLRWHVDGGTGIGPYTLWRAAKPRR